MQKRRRVEVERVMLDNVAEDPLFITRFITGNETWVYKYDFEIVQECSEWLKPEKSKLAECIKSHSSRGL